MKVENITRIIEMSEISETLSDGLFLCDISVKELKKEPEELQTKATAYDSQSVKNAIECDRIERILLNMYAYLRTKTLGIGSRVSFGDFKEEVEFFGKTKLEALTKALEWVEGENNK